MGIMHSRRKTVAKTSRKDIYSVPVYDEPTGALMSKACSEAMIPYRKVDADPKRYGLIPQCELQASSLLSMKQYIYGLKTVFGVDKYPDLGDEVLGTAIYIGSGYFITCAHNIARPGNGKPNSEEPDYTTITVYIKIPTETGSVAEREGSVKIKVDFLGSAFAGDPSRKYFIDEINNPDRKDLAVLRAKEEDRHIFGEIPTLKPALLDPEAGVTLTVINGACKPTVKEMDRYAEYCVPETSEFEAAVEALKPNVVTEWLADRLEPGTERDGASPAFVGYQISTTPGSSGSLLSQNNKFIGVHLCGPEQPIDELSTNRGVLIGTTTAKRFFRKYMSELIEIDSDWNDFIRG